MNSPDDNHKHHPLEVLFLEAAYESRDATGQATIPKSRRLELMGSLAVSEAEADHLADIATQMVEEYQRGLSFDILCLEAGGAL
jgi:hypothetical protein